LTIATNDESKILFSDLKDIHFGVKSKDINLCDSKSQYYRTKDGKIPDLKGPTAKIILES